MPSIYGSEEPLRVETNTMIKVSEIVDEQKRKYYCKISLYDECEDIKVINKMMLAKIIQKAKRIAKPSRGYPAEEFVIVVGLDFIRTFVKCWEIPLQTTTKLEVVYLNSVNRIGEIFKGFNSNCLFVVAKKEIGNLEKIWEK